MIIWGVGADLILADDIEFLGFPELPQIGRSHVTENEKGV